MQTQNTYKLGDTTYRISPFSAVFPTMSDEEYAEFRDDINKQGLTNPVVYTDPRDNKIIEGRHRIHALADINSPALNATLTVVQAPIAEPVSDDKINAFVMASNVHRRHLSTEQRALVAAALTKINAKTTVKQAAEVMNVSDRTVKMANRVNRHPDLAASVAGGETSLNKAHAAAKQREAPAKPASTPKVATPAEVPPQSPLQGGGGEKASERPASTPKVATPAPAPISAPAPSTAPASAPAVSFGAVLGWLRDAKRTPMELARVIEIATAERNKQAAAAAAAEPTVSNDDLEVGGLLDELDLL